MGVSHATVLRAIKRLEADLGSRLFDHIRTGYRLTPAGEAVLENVRAIERQVDTIVREQQGRDLDPAGNLRIMIPDVSLCNLMPLLGQFSNSHEKISLQIVKGVLSTPEKLLEHQVDAVISVTNEPSEELVGRQIRRLEFRSYCLRQSGKGKGRDQIRDWVLWGTQETDRELVDLQEKALRRYKDSRVIMRTATHDEALEAVRAGMGVAWLSSESHSAFEELTLWPSEQLSTGFSMGLWVLTHVELRSAGRVSAFLRFFS